MGKNWKMNFAGFDLDELIEDSEGLSIRALFDHIRMRGFSIEEAQNVFLDVLRHLISTGKADIVFLEWVDGKEAWDKAETDKQLDYIRQCFPKENNEKIPEQDAGNLWWYIECPVCIVWIRDDGSRWLCD